MLDTVITDSLGSLKTDVVGIAALYLIALVGIQGFRRMRYAAEFDSQYKKASQADPDGYRALSSESRQAWRKEYIASRAGGTRRLQAQRIQQGVFNGSRSRALGDAKKQYTPRRAESKSKTGKGKYSQADVKNRYGVKESKNKLGNHKYMPNGKRKGFYRSPDWEQKLPDGKLGLSYKEYKANKFQGEPSKSVAEAIRVSRAKNGKVW